jgi:carbamoyl-phosphate synthase large subunit
VPVKKVYKLSEGRPHVLDMIKNGEIAFIVNTPSGKSPRQDEVKIRGAAVTYRIPIMTTLSAAAASVGGIRSLQTRGVTVRTLQEYHRELPAPSAD